MSSGTRSDYGGGSAAITTYQQTLGRLGRMGLSPRQQELNRLWSFYRCEQYATRKIAWDGSNHVEHLEHEVIASAGYLPPGFYDAGGALLPLRFRRPLAPYHLCKVIVDRFTGLLFSEKRHPEVGIEGDDKSADFVQALARVGRLWPTMLMARTFGGAMGTVAVGFQFVHGKPHFEVHDPRWTLPKFRDRSNLILESVEKRYIYPVEVQDEGGDWVEVAMWYRRVIDMNRDVIYGAEPVGEGDEPVWRETRAVDHNLGYCPVVWMQNLPVVGDIDGEPDCQGIYDMCEAIDQLNSQAMRGTIANCDPTLVLQTTAPMDQVSKGSSNAIKLPDGSASYLEISGSGPMAAREQAREFRKMALEVAQVVLEQPETGQKTATEIERQFSSMLSKADVLREQYGERGVKPLLDMAIEATRKLGEKRVQGGRIVSYTVNLPPKVIGKANGAAAATQPRQLGPGPHYLDLKWPRYFEPSLQDAQLAVSASSMAKASNLVDDHHATKFIAEYFQIDDLNAMMDKVKELGVQAQSDYESLALRGMDEDEPSLSTPTPIRSEAAPTLDPADALNGAQIKALADLLMQVSAGVLPAASAAEVIEAAFPVTRDRIERMLAPLARKVLADADADGHDGG